MKRVTDDRRSYSPYAKLAYALNSANPPTNAQVARYLQSING